MIVLINIIITHILLFGILFPSNQNLVMGKPQAEVGIASIIENEKDVVINIYSVNKVPIAGVQFQIAPNDLFIIDSIAGGICSDLGFQLHSNEKGLLLAFSMQGKEIPRSRSDVPNENILFSVYGKKKRNFFNQVITLNTTLASRMGKKINSKVIDYIYK